MYTPKFSITNAILKNIGVVEAAREVIDHAPLLPYYEKQFQEDALARTVHHGTHIEGNELNLSQAEKVLSGQDVVARPRDIQEVINYRKVMEFIEESAEETKKQITKKFLQDIHTMTVAKILPTDKCGVFRKTQVVVKNSATGEVSFRPPAADKVLGQIDDLLAFINSTDIKDIHPVLQSGIVHYEFVRIHPFLDGNGRVGRALSTYILFAQGYDIRKFFSLEEYYDKDASSYYEALQSVEKQSGDLSKWLEYFTQGLAIELSKIKERVERISVDGKIKEKLGGKPLLLTDRQLKLIEYIQQVGYLQNKAFASLFPMVSEDTILNELKVLLEAGIIHKTGVTKGAKYVMK
ncbi:MAG TPA: Fic family protein [Candidatus Saccharimonadales bacterium]|nr:Fic family protein [Candidatus Saccharimonadales bacterium]